MDNHDCTIVPDESAGAFPPNIKEYAAGKDVTNAAGVGVRVNRIHADFEGAKSSMATCVRVRQPR